MWSCPHKLFQWTLKPKKWEKKSFIPSLTVMKVKCNIMILILRAWSYQDPSPTAVSPPCPVGSYSGISKPQLLLFLPAKYSTKETIHALLHMSHFWLGQFKCVSRGYFAFIRQMVLGHEQTPLMNSGSFQCWCFRFREREREMEDGAVADCAHLPLRVTALESQTETGHSSQISKQFTAAS